MCIIAFPFTDRRTGSFDLVIGVQLASLIPILGILQVFLLLVTFCHIYWRFKKRHEHGEVLKVAPKRAKALYCVSAKNEAPKQALPEVTFGAMQTSQTVRPVLSA